MKTKETTTSIRLSEGDKKTLRELGGIAKVIRVILEASERDLNVIKKIEIENLQEKLSTKKVS